MAQAIVVEVYPTIFSSLPKGSLCCDDVGGVWMSKESANNDFKWSILPVVGDARVPLTSTLIMRRNLKSVAPLNPFRSPLQLKACIMRMSLELDEVCLATTSCAGHKSILQSWKLAYNVVCYRFFCIQKQLMVMRIQKNSYSFKVFGHNLSSYSLCVYGWNN